MKDLLLRESFDLSNEILAQVGAMLCDEWGGNLNQRLEKLRTRGSFVLFEEKVSSGTVLGHAEVKDAVSFNSNDTIGFRVKNAILVSVITHKDKRSQGFGRILMEKVESVVKEAGYSYIYLWTNDAVVFYQKLGFRECESVSIVSNALKTVDVNKFENLLQQRLSSLASSSSSSCLELVSSSSDVWLRKRVQYSLPYSFLPFIQTKNSYLSALTRALLSSKSNYANSDAVDFSPTDTPSSSSSVFESVSSNQNNSFRVCTNTVQPLVRQTGPSCGIAAATMALLSFSLACRSFGVSSTDLLFVNDDKDCCDVESNKYSSGEISENEISEFLLREAITRGYSSDGELFNIHHLCHLVQLYLLNKGLFSQIPEEGKKNYGVSVSVVPTEQAFSYHNLSSLINRFPHTIDFTFQSSCLTNSKDVVQRQEDSEERGDERGSKCVFVILPYDRSTEDNSPCLKGGEAAHYALLSGIASRHSVADVGMGEDNNNNKVRNKDEVEESKFGENESPFLFFVHGMSTNPVCASLNDWMTSNAQLKAHKLSGNSKGWVVGKDGALLSGMCVVIEADLDVITCNHPSHIQNIETVD